MLDDKQLRPRYCLVATRSADFLLAALRPTNDLRRNWRAGNAGHPTVLEDFAALICGLLELYQTDFNDRWFIAARELAHEMIAGFSDESGGFFDTAADSEPLPVRPMDLQDYATPSGGALACEVLLKLAALPDRGDYRDLAERAFSRIADAAMRYPSAFGRWLNVADYALNTGAQIAVLFEGNVENAGDWLDIVNAEFRPNVVLAASPYPHPKMRPPSLLIVRSRTVNPRHMFAKTLSASNR